MTFHNLVFVVDADHGAQDPELDAKKQLLKRGLLQVLVLLGCRFGFDRVRWGYTFSRSGSGRTPRLVSRGSDFRELGQKTFEDLEVELESRFDPAAAPSRRAGPLRAAWLQKALREALLDFQWDRPDLTSPTKLSLRPRSSARAGRSGSREDDVSGSRNLVLVVAECPRSGTQLSRFLSLGSQDLPADPTEHLLSRGLRDLLLQRRVALHWVDSSSPEQVASCEDHLGFQRLSQVLAQVDGSVLPLVSLLDLCSSHQNLALRSSIGYLLCPDAVHRLAFPVLTGTLEWNQGAPSQRCHVLLEPLCRGQKLLPESVRVRLTAVLQDWDSSALRQPASECWVLHRSGCSAPGAEAFRHLLTELSARRLHLLSEVDDGGLLCSAVLSPLSPSAALLSLLPPDVAQARLLLTHQTSPAATGSTHLPRVVGGLLGVVCDLMEHSDTTDEPPSDPPVPEWAQQEVRLHPLGGGVLESWFPLSDQAGVSSHLMESMRVLHAVAEPQEPAVLAPELISGLAEVYQTRQPAGDRRARKRGAQRTPVKQKMRSMSRSLQMVNVARLNVKALKSQPEAEQPEAPQGAARRCSERKKRGEAPAARFSSEAALLAHLSSAYDSALSGSQPGLPAAAQLLLSAVKAFFGTEQVRVAAFVQQHLLRSSRSVRQVSSADSKVRECQLQVLLRLELCALSSPELDTEQASEEVADLLRIISLTQDPVCLTRFLQDHVLPGFLAAVPRVLAQVYHSLGTQLPEALLALLPADFFSDESVSKDSVSPSASASVSSPASEAGNQLQSLRDRSAHRRRRSSALTRHRSMTESSQSLRQIEMPQRTSRAARSRVCSAAEATKEETQEVTKVRRNLFNQEVASPSKKAKMPRSRSVSALEGLRRKRCQDQHRLLTRTVCETPLHKQVSKRLLQRQRMGRSSVPAEEEGVVEESPVKPAEDLRRSPRIRRFARRRSGSFYAGSQPRSRPLEAASAWQQPAAPPPVTSPMRLLFGAARSPVGPSEPSRARRPSGSRLLSGCGLAPALPETSASEGRSGAGVPSPETPPESPDRRRLPTRTRPRAAGPPRTPKTPPFSRAESGEEGPAADGSSGPQMVLRGSPFRSPAGTPTKLQSPLRGILRTPIRALGPGPSPGLEQLRSPVCRTPRKSVTWSPHQRGGTLVRDAAFKVPEWPQTPQRLKPGSGPGSPAESTRRNISRSLEQQTPEEPTSRPSAGPPEPEDGADGSPARSLAGRRSSHQGVGTRAPSAENLNWSGSRPSEVQSELSQTPDGGSGCSRLSSTSTDDSLDIVEAAVTRAQFTGGLRMNISFSRRSSQSQNLPAAPEPSGGTPARSYGLRQTPDRRQREAAARLGYGNQPRCSTPRGSAGPGPRKEPGPQNPLSYQVELERQTSGVPKLNLKRTDSTGAAEPGAPGPAAAFRGSRQREPGRGSPPSCAHTPAKSTPGKGLQTFICQSCTPTRRPGGTAPPVGAAESVPLTPSPQGLGRTPPDHLNSWPRRKRARPAAAGAKERGPAESVEEAELGVRRLQDGEELHPAASTRAPLEDFYWMERLAQQAGSVAPPPGEPASRDPRAAVSPPSLRGRRPVSASGILALTRSPLLFRGRSAAAEAAPAPGEGSGRRRAEEEGVDGSPGGRTSRRCSRTFSRKRLLT